VEDLGGRGPDIEVAVWRGSASTSHGLDMLVHVLNTSTQVMRTLVASPSADSGRRDTSLRRIYGPSCGRGRVVDCDCDGGAASAMFQKHPTRHGWLPAHSVGSVHGGAHCRVAVVVGVELRCLNHGGWLPANRRTGQPRLSRALGSYRYPAYVPHFPLRSRRDVTAHARSHEVGYLITLHCTLGNTVQGEDGGRRRQHGRGHLPGCGSGPAVGGASGCGQREQVPESHRRMET
jgi:hypothetical protein